jgi:hypothetical protein
MKMNQRAMLDSLKSRSLDASEGDRLMYQDASLDPRIAVALRRRAKEALRTIEQNEPLAPFAPFFERLVERAEQLERELREREDKTRRRTSPKLLSDCARAFLMASLAM